MKKYNINNYIRYKEDLKSSIPKDKPYVDYTRDEMIVKFIPLVETIARKFSTSQQASGVLTIMDLMQIGSEALVRAVDKLEWTKIEESEDQENIRRRIDICRGDIKIPEHQLTKIRKSPEDERMVAMFFNSIFSSIDDKPRDENPVYNIEDKSKQYNIHILNAYLLGLMKEHLTYEQYEAIRLSYGLDCDKHSAAQIAVKLGMKMNTAVVRVSQIKRDGIKVLIKNVDASQVVDYL